MDKKEIKICEQNGKLSTEKNDHKQLPYTAIFESDNIGTFYGYGRTKQEAIEDVKKEVQLLINNTE